MTAPKCRTCGHKHWGTCQACPECNKPVFSGVKVNVKVNKTKEFEPVKVNKEDVKLTDDGTGSCATCRYKLYYEKNNAYMKDYMKKKRHGKHA